MTWPLVRKPDAEARERLGRCPSCALRVHHCEDIDCNCPLLRCWDQRDILRGALVASGELDHG